MNSVIRAVDEAAKRKQFQSNFIEAKNNLYLTYHFSQ